MFQDALISRCQQYRYILYRSWKITGPRITFIGLNPSKADATTDDQTMRRLISFARAWGYSGLYMVNLFSYRSTDPRALLSVPDPVGDRTDRFIKSAASLSDRVVFCWGAFPLVKSRAKDIEAMFPEAYCFGKTAAGHPKHPLFLPSTTEIQKF